MVESLNLEQRDRLDAALEAHQLAGIRKPITVTVNKNTGKKPDAVERQGNEALDVERKLFDQGPNWDF